MEPVAGSNPYWKLCYRATSHGWSSGTFHSNCDGKGKTVTIIKKDQYVFGGYTDIPWGMYIYNEASVRWRSWCLTNVKPWTGKLAPQALPIVYV